VEAGLLTHVRDNHERADISPPKDERGSGAMFSALGHGVVDAFRLAVRQSLRQWPGPH